MAQGLSSRERMLGAIACQETDYVPCSFMIFTALRSQCKSEFEFVERELALGLDARVEILSGAPWPRNPDQGDLWGLPVRVDPQVKVWEWREELPAGPYPLLHRQYSTPAGTLHTAVSRTEDYEPGEHVPLFDDLVVPRARKRLITHHEDLGALRYLLTPPSREDIATLKESARVVKAFAQSHGVLVDFKWGSVVDTACWLAGMTELVFMAVDEPAFLQDLLDIIEDWNRQRMAPILDAGVDLFIRRGWYESSELWSPALYRRFILPALRRDAEMAHQAGAKFGYIMSTAQSPLAEILLESGIDTLIGLDPVQGRNASFQALKRKLGGQVCLWGGVNGFVTMELGTPEEVQAEVRSAFETLKPGGGFILSPVDNVTANTETAWRNVHALIAAWERGRDYAPRA
jgi:uroporphyrinogen-III decarboxylase